LNGASALFPVAIGTHHAVLSLASGYKRTSPVESWNLPKNNRRQPQPSHTSFSLKLLPSPLGHVIIRASEQITSCCPNRYFPDSSSVEITAPRMTNSPRGKWTAIDNNPLFRHLLHLLKIPRLRLRWPGTSINLLRVLWISSLSMLSQSLIMRLKSNGLTRPRRCD